jgi:hypothetical protein
VLVAHGCTPLAGSRKESIVSRRRLLLPILIGVLGLVPGSARADWILYLSGHLGMSSGTTSVAGSSTLVFGGRPFAGSYSDSSPLIAGAVGVAIPLNETTAWELPYDLRLPTWPLRFEAEATGLRRFEGITAGPTAQSRNFGGTDTWSVMFNFWQDVPLGGTSRLLSRLPGRTPRWLTRALDHMQVYGGAGIGVAGVDIEFTDNTHFAQADANEFAWQAGTGLTYSLTPVVTVDLGYRYFDYGSVSARYIGIGTGVDHGPFDVSQSSHEFRGGLRVNFWGFRPWR